MALYVYTLRDVLETYCYTRRWLRDQQADTAERLAEQMELQAAIAGVKDTGIRAVGRQLRERAARLRQPEWEPEESILGASDDQERPFYRAAVSEATSDELPDWTRFGAAYGNGTVHEAD